MTPQDRCERMRDIVFEILKRRYPETMPTKAEHEERHSDGKRLAIMIRDSVCCYFDILQGQGDRFAIRCILCGMYSDKSNDRIAVYYENKMNFEVLGSAIGRIVGVYSDVCHNIADEFGMGVEQ